MRHLILAVVLSMAFTSNAWANYCRVLPITWAVTPHVVRDAVSRGFDNMYDNSSVPHDADTDKVHACVLSKIDFFVDSIVLHCRMGFGDESEQIAFRAVLELCAKEFNDD